MVEFRQIERITIYDVNGSKVHNMLTAGTRTHD